MTYEEYVDDLLNRLSYTPSRASAREILHEALCDMYNAGQEDGNGTHS